MCLRCQQTFSDREGIVLPHTPRQGREVKVRKSRGRDPSNVQSHVIIIYLHDLCVTHSVARPSKHADQPLEGLKSERDVHPALIPPLLTEAEDGVVVATHKRQRRKHNMAHEEDLVHLRLNCRIDGGRGRVKASVEMMPQYQ